MSKKMFSLVFVTMFVISTILVPLVMAPVGPLQIVATISLGKEPECIAVNELTNRIYIGVEDGLLVIDCDSYASIANITTEARVISLSINSQTNRIYALTYGEGVAVVDGTTNQIIDVISETVFDSGSGACIAVNPFTNLVYIEDRTAAMGEYDRVNVYNGENNQFVTSLNIPGTNTHTFIEEVGFAINAETNRIYVTWSGNNTLHMFDGNTNEFIKTVQPSSFSEGVIVNTYTGYVYVGNVVLDGETLEEVFSDYEGYIETVDPINNLLYTADFHNLYVLNGTTHDAVASFELDWTFYPYEDCVGVNCETDTVYLTDNSETQMPVVIPEFTSMIMLSTLIMVTVVVLMYGKKSFKKTEKLTELCY